MQSPNSAQCLTKYLRENIYLSSSYLRDRQIDRIKEMCSDENASEGSK